jgi:excisionase family DNA binding protein
VQVGHVKLDSFGIAPYRRLHAGSVSHEQTFYGTTWPELEPLLSIREVARVLGVSSRTVLRLAAAGDLDPVRIGRRTLFEAAAVRGFLDQRRESGP